MPKVKLSYKVVNNLSFYINREIGKRMQKYGKKVYKRHLMNELADYCGVTRDNIHLISINISQPSLPVALKIADFFKVKVEEIFKIVE